jgi:hypothetical protein
MKNILKFLNGKKSIIGGILSLLIWFLQTKQIIDADTSVFLFSLSGLLLGVGITHKISKRNDIKNNNSNGTV